MNKYDKANNIIKRIIKIEKDIEDLNINESIKDNYITEMYDLKIMIPEMIKTYMIKLEGKQARKLLDKNGTF